MGKPVKLTRRVLESMLADVQGQANHLLELCQQYRIDERKSELMSQTMRQEFWDNPVAAKRIHTEIHRMELTQAMVDAIGSELDRLLYLNRDSALSASVMETIGRSRHEAAKPHRPWPVYPSLPSAIERCQAFVEVRLMGSRH